VSRRDESSAVPADSSDFRSSTEVTYRVTDNLSLTAGGDIANYEDKADRNNDYTEFGFIIRGLYNF
jgi:hypothetical protein